MKLALILFPLLVAAVSGLEDEKRFLLDSFESFVPADTITLLVKKMVDVVGSDATEGVLESACNKYASIYISSVGSHLVCPSLCQNFQHFVQEYGSGN